MKISLPIKQQRELGVVNKIRDNFEHENSCSGNKGVIRFGGELLID